MRGISFFARKSSTKSADAKIDEEKKEVSLVKRLVALMKRPLGKSHYRGKRFSARRKRLQDRYYAERTGGLPKGIMKPRRALLGESFRK